MCLQQKATEIQPHPASATLTEINPFADEKNKDYLGHFTYVGGLVRHIDILPMFLGFGFDEKITDS